MLATVPVTGLVLAGCGGSDASSSAGEQTIGVQQETTTAASSPTAASSERYDITSIMVCDTVDTTLSSFTSDTTAKQAKQAMATALAEAFAGSTTPDATVRTVKVNRLLQTGCPAVNSKAILATGVDDLGDLPVK